MTNAAKVIADSIGDDAPRILTFQLRYPKFIHGELMTHRVFSRNASSSRAIPVERLIQDVIDDPVYPSFWGKNQAGMQAAEECSELMELDCISPSRYTPDQVWGVARMSAIEYARKFARAGYHKQIVNRLLEPFCHINVVVTSTEWSNFFALRCHKDAQPEMRLLAEAMQNAMAASSPRKLYPGDWHLPYIQSAVAGPLAHTAPEIKVSVARCARVSYLTQEGKVPSVEDDLNLYNRLVSSIPLHASPAEHQATPDLKLARKWRVHKGNWNQPRLHGNFRGWIQYRKLLPNECL